MALLATVGNQLAWKWLEPDTDVEVCAVRLDVAPDAQADAVALLSDDELARAGRFVFDRDRRRFTVGRAALRKLLAERTGARPDVIRFDYSGYGKPRLAGGQPDIRFNVSHSADLAVYAFTQGREIGIDIERIGTVDRAQLAQPFLAEKEVAALQALDEERRTAGFFACWTRKEALVKAMGGGLSIPLDAFEVSIGEPAEILHLDREYGDPSRWTMLTFVPASGFVGALVVEVAPAAGFAADTPSPRSLPQDSEAR